MLFSQWEHYGGRVSHKIKVHKFYTLVCCFRFPMPMIYCDNLSEIYDGLEVPKITFWFILLLFNSY